MGIILLLLVALSINSWNTISDLYNKADYVNSGVSEAAAVALFADQVGETRARVTQYALSENDADLRAAQSSLSRIPDDIRTVTQAYVSDSTGGNGVDKLRALAERYRKSVAATIEAINARRNYGTRLTQAGTELSTTVAAIVEALAHDISNPGALDDAIRLMEAFQNSNASATRFLASRRSCRFRYGACGYSGNEPRL